MFKPIVLLLLLMPAIPTVAAQEPPQCIGGTCVEGPCGIVDRPDCWGHRFACYWIGRPMAALFPESICPVQPGCCNSTDTLGSTLRPTSVSRSSLWLPSLSDECENYGVEANVVVMAQPCQGSCENHGVQVNLVTFGDRCSNGNCSNTGVMVSVGQDCGNDGAVVCVDAFCSQPCGGSGCNTAMATFSPCQGDQTGLCECGSNGPSIAVGLTSCAQACNGNSISVVIGIQECGSCGNNGVQVIVGFSCDQAGVGVCFYGICKMIIDRSDEDSQANERPSPFIWSTRLVGR